MCHVFRGKDRSPGGTQGSGIGFDGTTVGPVLERDEVRREYVLRDRPAQGGERQEPAAMAAAIVAALMARAGG
ncbi:hypothetical protein V7793_01230 [Streptomyces sp. KLMMK]|uniref:hypothetical protein n=1 Tax=Streptomyces sp. KLMMK TaxID=3109353 RepID=UPI002FFFAC71